MYHWYRVTFTDGSVSIVAVPDVPYASLWDYVDRDSVVSFVYLGFYTPSPPPEPEPEPPPPPPPPPPYTKRVTVTAQNTSTRGGVGTSAILEITVGARLRGTERIGPYVSSMSFGPGETKTLQFDIPIGSADIGNTMVLDALVARPEGGIIASGTKLEVV